MFTVSLSLSLCVCVCVCVREREREREREIQTNSEKHERGLYRINPSGPRAGRGRIAVFYDAARGSLPQPAGDDDAVRPSYTHTDRRRRHSDV